VHVVRDRRVIQPHSIALVASTLRQQRAFAGKGFFE